MAWTEVTWACGHAGSMQLYGKQSARDAKVASEAGRKCMACWLVTQWEEKNDPRAQREDRYKLAANIAENKGKRIVVPNNVPVKNNKAALLAEKEQLITRIAEINSIIKSFDD